MSAIEFSPRRHEEKIHHRGTEAQRTKLNSHHEDTKNILFARVAREIPICSFVSLCLCAFVVILSGSLCLCASVVNLFFPPIGYETLDSDH